MRRFSWPNPDERIPVECSGGIRLENVRTYAETGVDFISVGLLTHSTHAADMSMRVLPPRPSSLFEGNSRIIPASRKRLQCRGAIPRGKRRQRHTRS